MEDSIISKAEYVELGVTCADVCETIDLGMDRRQEGQLSQSVLEAIEKPTMWVKPMMGEPGNFPTELSIRTVAEIGRHIIMAGKRYAISRRYHA